MIGCDAGHVVGEVVRLLLTRLEIRHDCVLQEDASAQHVAQFRMSFARAYHSERRRLGQRAIIELCDGVARGAVCLGETLAPKRAFSIVVGER